MGTFLKFHYFLIWKATLTNIIGNFEYQNRACSAKFSSRANPAWGDGGGGGRTKNETLFGGGSPRLFCTFTDSANVIFMLCFKINDAVVFFTFVF